MTRLWSAAGALAAVASALLAGAGPALAADGGQVWTTAGCGACHTLNVTGSRARVGPNLDEVAPTAVQVAAQVRSGSARMPSFSSKLSAEQIDAVAGFVAANAGRLPRNRSAARSSRRRPGRCRPPSRGSSASSRSSPRSVSSRARKPASSGP